MNSNTQNMTEEEVRRLSWRCRRGLLELDIVLQRFAENHLASLTAQELVAFNSVLDLPDNDFLDVITERIQAKSKNLFDEPAMQTVLAKLKQNY